MHATMASLFRPALSSARLQAERLCVGVGPSSMRLALRPAQSARIAAPLVRRTYATSSSDPTPTPPPGPPGGSSREEKAKDREAIGVSTECILVLLLFPNIDQLTRFRRCIDSLSTRAPPSSSSSRASASLPISVAKKPPCKHENGPSRTRPAWAGPRLEASLSC